MGISTDEMQRMKESTDWWSIKRYPLIEKEFVRNDSIKYVEKFGLPTPPRSACTFCPYHSNKEWLDLKKNKDESLVVVSQLDQQHRIQIHLPTKSLTRKKFCNSCNYLHFG